jgi:hypothetical protein
VTVVNSANLVANTIIAAPAEVTQGQTVTVVMNVSNIGSATATAVLPVTPTVSGSGSAAILVPATPLDIAGGANQSYTWTFNNTTAGNIAFSSYASGTDINSGFAKTSTGIISNNIVVQTAPSLAAVINAAPLTVRQFMDNITVVLNVTNNGQTKADNVVPAIVIGGTSAAVVVSPMTPLSANIPGAGSASFTWVYTGNGVGSLDFNANAAGNDTHTGAVTSAVSNLKTVQVVANTPLLSSDIAIMPADVAVGQQFTIIMTVTNIGLVDATAVTTPAFQGPAGVTIISGPAPVTQPIPSLATRSFTWRYAATTSGNKTFTGHAWAQNGNITSADSAASVVAHDPSGLTQDITLSPAVISVGQQFTIIFNVTNTGGSGVIGAVPGAFIKMGSGSYSYFSGPVPVTQTIAAGATAQFELVYTATAAGDLGVNAGIKGFNEYSGAPESSPVSSSSNMITVQSPASLANAIYAPSVVNKGQWFTVVMMVTNNGTTAADNTQPLSLNMDGAGGAIIQTFPAPVSIGPGSSQLFTFTYSAAGTGTINFRGEASGVDHNSLVTVTSPETSSNMLTINKPAGLAISLIKMQPTSVGTGEFIDLVLSVTNTGDTASLNVTPTALAINGAGTVNYISGSIPGNSPILIGNGSTTFSWRYQANTAGVVTFSSTMLNAVDQISGQPVTITPVLSAVSVTIVNQAALNIPSIDAALTAVVPGTVSSGQNVTVIMNVANNGTGDAINVAPSAVSVFGSAGMSYLSGPSPAATGILSGASAQFTWVYTATSAGTSVFSIKVSGTDSGSLKAITSAPVWSNTVTVQQPASLIASLSAVPPQATVGQIITLTLAVTNNGGTMAQQSFGAAPVITGSGSAIGLSAPVPADIPAGSNALFVWTYSANSSGVINFIGEALGYDYNTKITATAGVSANNINIQTPPQLTAAITAQPAIVGVGNNVTVVMSASNSGQASLGVAVPIGFVAGGTATHTFVSGPVPSYATITAGSTVSYTWVYTATGIGNMQFNGAVSGSDVNNPAAAYSSASAASNSVLVQPNFPVMQSYVTVSPNAVSINQKFTVILTVSNIGIVAAPLTTPNAPAVGVASTLFSGPTPSNANIPSAGTAYFTWVYTAQAVPATGVVNTTAVSSAQTSADVSNGVANAITVTGPPSLDGNYMLLSQPPSGFYSVGQVITLTMTISNDGATDAVNVAPQFPLTRIGTGNAAILTGPAPAAMPIAAGATGTFTWNVQATAAGDLEYYGRATGQDSRTLATYQSVTATSTQVHIQSPSSLISNIAIQGSKMDLGQQVTVIMNVSNAGQANAVNVTPSDLFITNDSTGGMIPPIGPLPTSQPINGGANGQFTWVFQATGQGLVTLSGNASAVDANSGLPVASPMVRSTTIDVQLPPQLAVNVWAVPAQPSTVKRGQQITVYMSVTNSGQADATAVTPTALNMAPGGLAALNTTPAPAAVIAGGTTTVFTWIYDSSAAGNLTFNGTVNASDVNTGVALAQPPASTSNTIQIVDSAYLASSMSVSQQVVSLGQQVTVVLTVTNIGSAQTAATANVTGTATVINMGGGVTVSSSPAPIAPILTGASASFTWIYNTTATGTLAFSGYASYVDIDGAKQTIPLLSPLIQVQSAPALTAAISAPANVNNGQLFTVTMVVTNTGGARALNVAPSLVSATVSGAPDIALTNIISPLTIPGGNAQSFQFVYMANTSGVLYFSGSAAGTDENSGSAVLSPWTPRLNVSIQVPVNLSITAFNNIPPVVAQQQFFTVQMTVSNLGDGSAANIMPFIFGSGSGAATLLTGPSPVSAPALAGHGSVTFTWTYSAAATGIVNFSSGANGSDINTSLPATTGPSPVITESVIAKQAILTSELIIKPVVAGYNQLLTVQLSVTNTGLYPAAGVQPDALLYAPAALLGLPIPPNPGAVALNVGQSHIFQWVFSTTYTAGTLSFSTRAMGTDNPTPGPGVGAIYSGFVQNSAAISAPPSLYASLVAYPSAADEGQNITIVMTVTNAGAATANNVIPTQLFKGGTGVTNPSNPNSPVPASANIAAGTSMSFTWIVAADPAGAGTVQWTGWANGTDINSGAPVSATQTVTNLITIQVPPSLSTPDIALPAFVTAGQTITVTMSVTNLGQGTVTGAAPNPLTLNMIGSGGLIPLTIPAPADIAANASATYTWTYSAAGAGTLQLSGQVSGTDVNLGIPYSSPIRTSSQMIIQSPAQLASSIYVNPPVVYNGQVFTISLVVTNNGQATAVNVSGTPIAIDQTPAAPGVILSQIGPLPTTYTVTGGKTFIFKWTYTAFGNGIATFSSGALGIESNSGNPLSTAVLGATVTILPSASLSSSMTVSKQTLAVGQQLTVDMTIINSGVNGSIAYNAAVQPASLFRYGTVGSFSYVSGPTIINPVGEPVPVTLTADGIPADGTVTYQWIYSATAAGVSNFSGLAVARDANIGQITDLPQLSLPVTVQTAAALTAASSALPTVVDTNQQFTVKVTVTNTGGSNAMHDTTGVMNSLDWSATVTGGPAVLTTVSGPTPATNAQDYLGNSSMTYQWIFTSDSKGVFSLTATAHGIDENTGNTINSASSVSNNVTINNPAHITSFVSSFPVGTVSRTQLLTVVLTVSNTGDSRANGVTFNTPVIQVNTAGAAVALQTSPSGTVNLNSNSTARFTWTYLATAEGNITFSVSAVPGTDNVSGAASIYTAADNNGPSVSFDITQPLPNLQFIALNAISVHNPLYFGESVTIIASVKNTGIVGATAVTPTVMVDPLNPILNGPGANAPSKDIPVGATVDFTWVFSASNIQSGSTTVSVGVSGTPQGLTWPVVSAWDNQTVNVKPSGSSFIAQISALPTTVAISQFITVILTATNNGQTIADVVVPITPTVSAGSTGAAVLISTAPANPISVAPLSAVSFTWTFSASAGGTVNFSSGVSWVYTDVFTATQVGGSTSILSGAVTIAPGIPEPGIGNTLVLDKNTFNPAAGQSVDVEFSTAKAGNAQMLVFNVAGQIVRNLQLGPVVPGIEYTQLAVWDGTADDKLVVTSGIYYIKIKVGSTDIGIKTVAVVKK